MLKYKKILTSVISIEAGLLASLSCLGGSYMFSKMEDATKYVVFIFLLFFIGAFTGAIALLVYLKKHFIFKRINTSYKYTGSTKLTIYKHSDKIVKHKTWL